MCLVQLALTRAFMEGLAACSMPQKPLPPVRCARPAAAALPSNVDNFQQAAITQRNIPVRELRLLDVEPPAVPVRISSGFRR